jgi:group I intron endonuclease
MVTNYANSRIYKITCNDYNITDMYIGSTIQTLSSRKSKHVNASKTHPDVKLYKFVSNNGGWSNFKIILQEWFPCANKDQLHAREQYWKDLLKPTLDSIRSFGHNKKPEELTFGDICGGVKQFEKDLESLKKGIQPKVSKRLTNRVDEAISMLSKNVKFNPENPMLGNRLHCKPVLMS